MGNTIENRMHMLSRNRVCMTLASALSKQLVSDLLTWVHHVEVDILAVSYDPGFYVTSLVPEYTSMVVGTYQNFIDGP